MTGSWTPAWVRDAVFYQIFPDRFASSARVAKPGPMEPWDSAADGPRLQGRRPIGVVEHLDHIQAPRRERDLSQPDLPVGVATTATTRSTTSAVDPLLGGDAALRELIDACHARGMRVVLDGVFNHASRGFWPFHHVLEMGRASPYRDWFIFDAGRPRSRARPMRAVPLHRPGRRRLATSRRSSARRPLAGAVRLPRHGGACRPCRSSTRTTRRCGSTCSRWPSTGSGSASMAGVSTSREEVPGRVLAGVPPPGQGGRSRRLHRRGDLARGAGGPPRRHVRRPDELPAGCGDHVVRRGGPPRPPRARAARRCRAGRPRRGRRRPSPTRLSGRSPSTSRRSPAVQLNLLDSHDTPRFLSMVGGDTTRPAPGDAHPDDGARRADRSTTATRSGCSASWTRQSRRLPVGRARSRGTPRSWRTCGGDRAPPRESGPAPRELRGGHAQGGAVAYVRRPERGRCRLVVDQRRRGARSCCTCTCPASRAATLVCPALGRCPAARRRRRDPRSIDGWVTVEVAPARRHGPARGLSRMDDRADRRSTGAGVDTEQAGRRARRGRRRCRGDARARATTASRVHAQTADGSTVYVEVRLVAGTRRCIATRSRINGAAWRHASTERGDR